MAEIVRSTIRWCCRTTCRCRRTTAPRAISPACGCRRRAAGDRRRVGQPLEAQGPHRRLCLSAHRTARAGAADRLGRDPRRARLHAAVLRLPRSFRRAEAARRGALFGLSTQDTAYQREAGRAAASAVCDPVGRGSQAHPRAQAADVLGRRHDADQAHGLGDRRRRDLARVLSGVSAGQERRDGGRVARCRALAMRRRGACAPRRTPRGTSPASARRCSCCSASSDSC